MIKKISISKLKKQFGNNVVLNNINLDIYEQESLAIIGESGSGKSVLTKCINGLIEFDDGQIIFENSYDVKQLKRNRILDHISNFGVLFQNSALFDSLTIEENIFFQRKDKDYSILKDVSLDFEILKKMPSDLSAGMQKRVSLARAIVSRPKILIFDEPTTGLDPIMANQINLLLRKLVTEKKLTTITITHDMESVYEFADKVAFIKNGKIMWYGDVGKISKSNSVSMKKFIEGLT
tara:strand:- start:85 stop:792 length:708 start_codon:yes stop_codon:yes gene_type:complete